MLYIGLISGTSADGIDAALVDTEDDGFRLLNTRSCPYSPGIRESIESVIHSYPDVGDELGTLDKALGKNFARAAVDLIVDFSGKNPITAIGSHGQTVYHGPGDSPPVSIQLADPQVIADTTGIITVGDFRSNDMRAGGQGAPLAPAFHNAMFRCRDIDRVVVNIGGISNITTLPADPLLPVRGFDTGPGNTLMDQWYRLHQEDAFDPDGQWAATGRPPSEFVDALLDDSYFHAPAPKSTGREYFHLEWMKQRFPRWCDESPADIQAGLLEVTARSIIAGVEQVMGQDTHSCEWEMYICGGGAHNGALMKRLGELATGKVESTDELGLSPDWVEACAFAWLAHRRMHEQPGNLPSVTGATREVLLGEIFRPGRSGGS